VRPITKGGLHYFLTPFCVAYYPGAANNRMNTVRHPVRMP